MSILYYAVKKNLFTMEILDLSYPSNYHCLWTIFAEKEDSGLIHYLLEEIIPDPLTSHHRKDNIPGKGSDGAHSNSRDLQEN